MASLDFASAFDRQIAKHLLLSFDEWPTVIPVLYHTENFDGFFEEHFSWSGYDLPTFRLPGEPITQSAVHENYGKRYTRQHFGNGDSIPLEYVENDPTGILTQGGARIAGGLANSFQQLMEIAAADNLINMFTVTAGTPDGAAGFSLSHPRSKNEPGTLDANRPTANEDITVTGVQEMITRVRTQRSPNGIPMQNEPQVLWHSPANKFAVDKILHNSVESDTMDRNDNFVKKYDLRGVEIPYLMESGVASDAWGIRAKKHFMYFFMGQRPKGRNQIDAVTNAMLTMWTMSFDIGHSDWRGQDASPGV